MTRKPLDDIEHLVSGETGDEPGGEDRARLAAELSEALQARAVSDTLQEDTPIAVALDGALPEQDQGTFQDSLWGGAEQRLDFESAGALVEELAGDLPAAPPELLAAAAVSLGRARTPDRSAVAAAAPATPRRPAWWRRRPVVGAALAMLSLVLIAPAALLYVGQRAEETGLPVLPTAAPPEDQDRPPPETAIRSEPLPAAPPAEARRAPERVPGTRQMRRFHAGESERWLRTGQRGFPGTRAARERAEACREAEAEAKAKAGGGRTAAHTRDAAAAGSADVALACLDDAASGHPPKQPPAQPAAGALPEAQPAVPDPLR